MNVLCRARFAESDVWSLLVGGFSFCASALLARRLRRSAPAAWSGWRSHAGLLPGTSPPSPWRASLSSAPAVFNRWSSIPGSILDLLPAVVACGMFWSVTA